MGKPGMATRMEHVMMIVWRQETVRRMVTADGGLPSCARRSISLIPMILPQLPQDQ